MKKWTDADNQRLKDLYGVFAPAEVAKMMDRSVDAIHQQAMKLGIQYVVTGMSSPEALGRKHKIDPSVVRRIVAHAVRYKRGETKRLYDDFLADEAIELYKHSISLNELTKLLGVNYETAKHLLLGYDPIPWIADMGLIDPQTVQAIVQEYKETLTHEDISSFSARIGSDPNTVKRTMRRLGIYYNTEKKLSPKEMQMIEQELTDPAYLTVEQLSKTNAVDSKLARKILAAAATYYEENVLPDGERVLYTPEFAKRVISMYRDSVALLSLSKKVRMSPEDLVARCRPLPWLAELGRVDRETFERCFD